MTTWGRIRLSRRQPRPRILNKSRNRLNFPSRVRSRTMAPARLRPIPGSRINCSMPAVFNTIRLSSVRDGGSGHGRGRADAAVRRGPRSLGIGSRPARDGVEAPAARGSCFAVPCPTKAKAPTATSQALARNQGPCFSRVHTATWVDFFASIPHHQAKDVPTIRS